MTDRKRAEAVRETALESTRLSEEKYRLLAENAKDVIWTISFEGLLGYVSPSVREMTGYTAGDLRDRHIAEIIGADQTDQVMEVIAGEIK